MLPIISLTPTFLKKKKSRTGRVRDLCVGRVTTTGQDCSVAYATRSIDGEVALSAALEVGADNIVVRQVTPREETIDVGLGRFLHDLGRRVLRVVEPAG